jgi:hypothetical protein
MLIEILPGCLAFLLFAGRQFGLVELSDEVLDGLLARGVALHFVDQEQDLRARVLFRFYQEVLVRASIKEKKGNGKFEFLYIFEEIRNLIILLSEII